MESEPCWFVLRDLKRSNAKKPAYELLKEQAIDVFTPMKWTLIVRQGRRLRTEVPVMHDLLFAHATRDELDPVIDLTPTLQYRYVRGKYCCPMVVPEPDMRRFIHAVRSCATPLFYRPDELTPAMYGKIIRIVGGPLDGYEGPLLTIRGSRKKRLLVDLPNLLAAGVEVNPEFIQFV